MRRQMKSRKSWRTLDLLYWRRNTHRIEHFFFLAFIWTIWMSSTYEKTHFDVHCKYAILSNRILSYSMRHKPKHVCRVPYTYFVLKLHFHNSIFIGRSVPIYWFICITCFQLVNKKISCIHWFAVVHSAEIEKKKKKNEPNIK